MIYMITLDDGRLFVATEENLDEVKQGLSDNYPGCLSELIRVDGPHDFVEITQSLPDYDPQTLD